MAEDPTSSSLLAALNCRGHVHLIIGTNPLAATRCGQSLNAGAIPVLIAPETSELHYGLAKRIETGEVTWHKKSFQDNDLFTLGREEIGHVVDAVFVTTGLRNAAASHLSALCKKNRIPINVVDAPHLCSFSILSTHTDGPLQVGVTTNGRGCKLASRIRREIAATLPTGLGSACARLGDVRRRVQQEDQLILQADEMDDSLDQTASFNKLVTDADLDAVKNRRMRWLGQVCEYWPLKRLAAITDSDIDAVLKSYSGSDSSHPASASTSMAPPPSLSMKTSSTAPKRGKIILAGSGPGHPDLLTRATYKAMQSADLILADKLVPAPVLDLVPRRTSVQIARKFPGNADAAQEELHSLALTAARDEGKTVLRLKQGDPFLYGRGGEEVEFFRQNGMGDRVVVLPGITSALSAPLFASVPATQRDVADQVLICTGTGKKGKPPAPPEYVSSRTVVFLMALHRIEGLVRELTTESEIEAKDESKKRILWPRDTPCAVIERASCPDQRVIRTTLAFVAEAIEAEGSRPPGLLVAGRACEALYTPEKGRSWTVEDGFGGLQLDSEPDLVIPA